MEQRHYVDDGQGSTELGMMAAEQALAAAGRTKDDIDAIVFATMTPDHFFPGNGPVLQARMGFAESTPAFDIRQQCSGFLYGLDLADSLIRSGKWASRIARRRRRSTRRIPRSAIARCSSATVRVR